jgi:hypothetical protein
MHERMHVLTYTHIDTQAQEKRGCCKCVYKCTCIHTIYTHTIYIHTTYTHTIYIYTHRAQRNGASWCSHGGVPELLLDGREIEPAVRPSAAPVEDPEVSMYVCMYVCMHVCMYFVWLCFFVCTFCVYVCIYVYMHVHVYVYMYDIMCTQTYEYIHCLLCNVLR